MCENLIRIDKCSGCGKVTKIQNKYLNLCANCVYKRTHRGMSRYEVLRKRQADREAELRRRFRRTGERDMFLRIWNQRPHFCINCGKWLGDDPMPIFFSHRVAKSVSEVDRLNPDNIDLLCGDCHFARDHQGRSVYEKRGKR